MKNTIEKKQAILLYILEKIDAGAPNISRVAADAWGISVNTVRSYLKQLIAEGIVSETKRGEYELITTHLEYTLKSNDLEWGNDMYLCNMCLTKEMRSLPANVLHIWEYSLSEMLNNVFEHSQASSVHISVSKNYLKTSVIITDDGVGIFEKIKEYFNLPTLEDVICELFKGKLTTNRANHSGEGIFFTSKMMDEFLISSTGKVFTTSKFDDAFLSSVSDNSVGTRVLLSLSNFSNKTVKEFFDCYSDVDDGFTTTIVPLKNIFDTIPVSRSQAKRVCNRLDQFRKVIIDFEDIEWMGQGFAHQVFVVFGDAHPEISLCVANMNEDVEKMYRHVLSSKER